MSIIGGGGGGGNLSLCHKIVVGPQYESESTWNVLPSLLRIVGLKEIQQWVL